LVFFIILKKRSSYIIAKALKMAEYNEEEILICISSVMVWSSTPPKEERSGIFLQLNIIIKTSLFLIIKKLLKIFLISKKKFQDRGCRRDRRRWEECESDEDEVNNAAAGGEGDEVAKKTYLHFTERDYA
jgi:hypothetical protein